MRKIFDSCVQQVKYRKVRTTLRTTDQHNAHTNPYPQKLETSARSTRERVVTKITGNWRRIGFVGCLSRLTTVKINHC